MPSSDVRNGAGRIKVPTAKEVAENRERELGEKRNLFRPSSSSDNTVEVPVKRVRPDSRRLKETENLPEQSSGFVSASLSLSSKTVAAQAMDLAPTTSLPTTAASEPENRIRLLTTQEQAKTGIVINKRQVGNPALRYLKDVVYSYSDKLVSDFLLGQHVCALFLSFRYHLLHPEYIYGRIRHIGEQFRTRVLLCLVDVHDHEQPMRELTKMCIIYGWTLVCVSSNKEAARYLESYRIYENKSAETIMQRADEDYFSKLQGALSSVRMVNKTDVKTLALNFGSLKNIVQASKEV